MSFFTAFAALTAMAVTASLGFLLEAWLYRRRLHQIPIRIHVNGTRGKSSVARLIAAGLRSGGVRTCAKTTGTLARMIFPDGTEMPIFRPARANVIEQKRVVRAAVNSGAEALVIECMALQPLLQTVCELKLVQSTLGVITNARADHLDVMGPTRLDVARALAGTTPVGGTLFTAESRADSLSVMQMAASDRGSRMVRIDQRDSDQVTPEILAKFSYMEHAENVALALQVCQAAGVDRESALLGMWAASPDPGAMRVHCLALGQNSQWHFVNGFAANDPESTEGLWASAFDRFPGTSRRVLVMNCREDRPDRSTIMGQAVGAWLPADQIIVIGTGTEMFVRAAFANGVAAEKLSLLGDATSEEIANAIADHATLTEPSVMVMGIGNVAGPGFRLERFFEQNSVAVCGDDGNAWTPTRLPEVSRRLADPVVPAETAYPVEVIFQRIQPTNETTAASLPSVPNASAIRTTPSRTSLPVHELSGAV
ncbi:poly-gamma-glutamate synthase PgsB [Rubripirellula lacrimiformis]|uniref:poly-gamma-glutamate synthase PgsB n=1 Tax=Rubripirellula lacrimiformis TaxID=1930273 RepID=UPI001FE7F339|nr:poly-gamma-glutamate synthase PgsB [Rubripirellula lacrimiformis]